MKGHSSMFQLDLKMTRIFICFFNVLLKSAFKLISCFLHDQLNSHAHTSILTNQLGMLRNHYITICGLAFMEILPLPQWFPSLHLLRHHLGLICLHYLFLEDNPWILLMWSPSAHLCLRVFPQYWHDTGSVVDWRCCILTWRTAASFSLTVLEHTRQRNPPPSTSSTWAVTISKMIVS